MDNIVEISEIAEPIQYKQKIQLNDKKVKELMLSTAKKKLAGKSFGNNEYVYTINEITDIHDSLIRDLYEIQCIATTYKLKPSGMEYTSPVFRMFLVDEYCELKNDLHELQNFVPYKDLLIGRNSPIVKDINGKFIENGYHVTFERNGILTKGEVIGFDMSTSLFTVKFDTECTDDKIGLCQLHGKEMKIIN